MKLCIILITEQYSSSEQYSMWCALKTKDSEKGGGGRGEGGRGEGGGGRGRVGEGVGGCRAIDLSFFIFCEFNFYSCLGH